MVRVLVGTNSYLLNQRLRSLVSEFSRNNSEGIEKFDASELESVDAVINAVRNLSLFSEDKMVIVKYFSQNKQLFDAIEQIIEETPESTHLVLVDDKIDKRSAVYKALKKSTEFEEFEEVKPYEITSWLNQRAKEKGLDIGSGELRYLLDRSGPNQALIDKELEKLALINGPISRKHIEDLVEKNPQSKIFDLLEALFNGDSENAWGLYNEQKAQGEDSYKILGMIVWQLQQLVLVVFAPEKSKDFLVQSGMSPYTAEKNMRLARKIDKAKVRKLVSELSEIDHKSKTSADIDSALETYFSEVALITS